MEEDKIIEERKAAVIKFFKTNPSWIFIIGLALIVILGFYIRYLPLTDHGGHPGLWDITTNDYTLGPDLDPFLFLRYAREMIENGSLSSIDEMRNVPLGFDTSTELQMVSYSIVLTYKLVNLFGNHSINFAGAFMPVLAFILTIIAFFFFVREIFIRKNDKKIILKANLIALIATLFMTILPAFLSRTVAGIPEKESVGFFFMFLAFYLFLKAWKSEKIIYSSIFGILAGISTALMGLTWGGVTYIYVAIGLAGLIAFILNKFEIKEICAYGLWLISSLAVTLTFTNRFSLKGFLLGTDTGIASVVFALIIVNYIIWKTNIHKTLRLEKIKMPKTIITFILVILLGLIALLIISPGVISEKIGQVSSILIKPVTGRWSTTVAENKQPYFTEWFGSFGKPVFWLFFIGSILLFYNMINKIKKKDALILTCLYGLFFFGLVFSRYAAHPALFDGENFISKFFYFGSALLLVGSIIYYYVKYHRENDFSFEKTELEYILLFSLFVLTLFTARSAVRLIMVLVPIAPIFLSYLLVESGYNIKYSENKNMKILFALLFIVGVIFSLIAVNSYYQNITVQADNYIPYYYTYQWQEAMSWIRNNTSPNAVFAHWWDYGYWVQSIGNRATVTDGANVMVWWNYLTGRLVLTGDNQQDSLNFLWNHNATHLLIDSSDIGKYGAFSQIGSDKNYDRFSYGPTVMVSDNRQTQETAEGLIRIYPSNSPVDEDINYLENGTNVFIPGASISSQDNIQYNAAIAGIILETKNIDNATEFKQPQAVYYYQGKQITLPLRYIYYENKLYDYKTGINAAISIVQKIDADGNGGMSLDQMGAIIYLSPRILRGFLGQVYILDDAFNNFPNFKIVHSEPDYIISSINAPNVKFGEFVYYQGLRGPIKIWEIKYSGKETINKDYTLTQPPNYITWKF